MSGEQVKIRDLRIGDMVDLSTHKITADHPTAEMNYAEVVEVEQETTGCTCVYFEGVDAYGLPSDDYIFVAERRA